MKFIYIILFITIFPLGCKTENAKAGGEKMSHSNSETNEIVLGGGCFWCVEAVFQDLQGVEKVVSGYSGGKVKNPSYEQICTGTTGHAEVVKVIYNPKIIDINEIFEVFFATHDPTTLNRQGADVGTQYRSVIFYKNDEQKQAAEKYINFLENEKAFDSPIVTKIESLNEFYAAENYHQNYYKNNSSQPYCRVVINPKLEKLKKNFKNKLKSN